MEADSSQRRAILVLGMHRSGTSALAAALQALGVPLGEDLLVPGEDNPGGYFEHAAAVTAHEELLASLGRGWDDVRALPEGWSETEAGKRAASAVCALLSLPFARAPLWAVKDPRLCRVLPLWNRVLRAEDVQPCHLMVVRHPDEVAASLARRNGFPLEYGHLLWLLYVLEAERDSRGTRCVLTYDALLGDPVGSLRRAGADLGIAWPNRPEDVDLGRLLDPSRRHHRADPENGAAGNIRAGNLALYAALASPSGGDAWPDLDPHVQRLDAWRSRNAPWLEAAGTAISRARLDALEGVRTQRQMTEALERAEALSFARLSDAEALDARLRDADAALQEAQAFATGQQKQLHALDDRVSATDAALEEAKALALARQQELLALDTRMRATDAALKTVQDLAEMRLAELHALDARTRQTDAALEAAKALVVTRQSELEALGKRLRATEAALQQATSLATIRQAELEALDGRLRSTDVALREAAALARARQVDVDALGERVRATDAALEKATALATERQAELELLDARVRATDAALEKATALATERQAEVEALDARVRLTDAALGKATALAMERLAQLGSLHDELEKGARAHAATRAELELLSATLSQEREQATNQLENARAEIDALQRDILERDARIRAVLASASWRITRPLRWLAQLLGMRGRPRS